MEQEGLTHQHPMWSFGRPKGCATAETEEMSDTSSVQTSGQNKERERCTSGVSQEASTASKCRGKALTRPVAESPHFTTSKKSPAAADLLMGSPEGQRGLGPGRDAPPAQTCQLASSEALLTTPTPPSEEARRVTTPDRALSVVSSTEIHLAPNLFLLCVR